MVSYLMLTITPAAYLAMAGVPFVPPIAPPPAEPVLPNDAPSSANITEANPLRLAYLQENISTIP